MELIKQLAALAGLQDSYVHAQGHTEVIDLDKQQAILLAMGFDLSSEQTIQQQIDQLTEQPWLEVIPPVTVCEYGQPVQVRLQQLQHAAVSDWQWQITTEDLQVFSGKISVNSSDIAAKQQTRQGVVLAANLSIDVSLELGYHQLEFSSGGTHLPTAADCYTTALLSAAR